MKKIGCIMMVMGVSAAFEGWSVTKDHNNDLEPMPKRCNGGEYLLQEQYSTVDEIREHLAEVKEKLKKTQEELKTYEAVKKELECAKLAQLALGIGFSGQDFSVNERSASLSKFSKLQEKWKKEEPDYNSLLKLETNLLSEMFSCEDFLHSNFQKNK